MHILLKTGVETTEYQMTIRNPGIKESANLRLRDMYVVVNSCPFYFTPEHIS